MLLCDPRRGKREGKSRSLPIQNKGGRGFARKRDRWQLSLSPRGKEKKESTHTSILSTFLTRGGENQYAGKSRDTIPIFRKSPREGKGRKRGIPQLSHYREKNVRGTIAGGGGKKAKRFGLPCPKKRGRWTAFYSNTFMSGAKRRTKTLEKNRKRASFSPGNLPSILTREKGKKKKDRARYFNNKGRKISGGGGNRRPRE